MLTIDAASAGVVATVYAALLIALAIHPPSTPREGAPAWVAGAIYAFEFMRIMAFWGAATSIPMCLMIVCGGDTSGVADWFATVTMWLLLGATISWVMDNFMIPLRRNWIGK